MPHKFKLDKPPIGYAASACGPGESTVQVVSTEFSSTEDGQHFINRLEGFPMDVLSEIRKTGTDISPSRVDHMLVLIDADANVTAYVNELKLHAMFRVGRSIEAGESVFKNDIVDIHSFGFDDVKIPDDVGVLFVFSVGWRKGLFFDYRPLPPLFQPIKYDLNATFGQFYAHVLFQERFSISNSDWEHLFDSGWFPFNALTGDNIQSILTYVRNGWKQANLLEKLTENIVAKVEDFRACWSKADVFEDHSCLLTHSLDRFVNHDYISCISILYPRIEGLLRSNHRSLGDQRQASQKNLSETAVRRYAWNERCVLLPRRFQAYLESVYFQSFDPNNRDINCSRNSVGHGVANQDNFNQQAAIVAILVVQQLFYFFSETDKRVTGPQTESGS
ncbi:hypothetical protein [Neorhodopirellula lusitana]|uniref:hypothetical protein n=1 Tax=Neorhodopirellula lusitana TaxID=445327 RepID=UPI00384E785B